MRRFSALLLGVALLAAFLLVFFCLVARQMLHQESHALLIQYEKLLSALIALLCLTCCIACIVVYNDFTEYEAIFEQARRDSIPQVTVLSFLDFRAES